MSKKKQIRGDLLKLNELREQLKDFLEIFSDATRKNNFSDINAPEWSRVREFLNSLSYSRGIQGFTPSETALFIFT